MIANRSKTLVAVLVATLTVSVLSTTGRWRHIDSTRAPPRTLQEAKMLHEHGRTAMWRAGHQLSGGRLAKTAAATMGGTAATGSAVPPWIRARKTSCLGNGSGSGSGSASRTVSPMDFGADPTGVRDSTAAMAMAMAQLLGGAHPLPPMADAIVDLGGATLDLAGGDYLVSMPIVVPKLVGNLRVRGGSLRANSTAFPSGRFLIEVGEEGCNDDKKQKVCNEYIGFADLFLDASHVAAGGIRVANTMGTTIETSFCTGYVEAGVRVLAGHETLVDSSWFAEYYWDAQPPADSKSTGIELNGQDNYVTNVIVFDYTKLGVLVNGAATLLEGVHTWNGGGVGIMINGSYTIQDRLLGCYLDYNTLTIVDPTQTTVEDTFFLDTNAVLVQDKKPVIQSVVFRENVYCFGQYGKKPSVAIDGVFNDCSAVTVADELAAQLCTDANDWNCGVVQTRASRSVKVQNALNVTVDFGRRLMLPRIDHVQFSVTLRNDIVSAPIARALEPEGTNVTVLFDAPTTGTLHIDVSQCS